VSESKFEPNYGLYARLAEPVSEEVAKQRIDAFSAAVKALREEHGIPELVVAIVVYTDDKGGGSVACGQYGAVGHSFKLANVLRRECLAQARVAIEEAAKSVGPAAVWLHWLLWITTQAPSSSMEVFKTVVVVVVAIAAVVYLFEIIIGLVLFTVSMVTAILAAIFKRKWALKLFSEKLAGNAWHGVAIC